MKDLRAKYKYSFWVFNVSKQNVSLRDLNITIPAGAAMNLLDDKHHNYTLDQLQASKTSGSLYLKQNKLKISDNPPQIIIKPGISLSRDVRYVAPRSGIKVEEKKYNDLFDTDQSVSEEKFANEFSGEFEEDDRIIKVPNKR